MQTENIFEKRTFWNRASVELKKSPGTARFGMIVILFYIIVSHFLVI